MIMAVMHPVELTAVNTDIIFFLTLSQLLSIVTITAMRQPSKKRVAKQAQSLLEL